MTSLIHDTVSLPRYKKRSPLLTCPRHFDAAPIPPTLANSPYLSSPDSVFRRKFSLPRWPSRESNEWLRDMVPIDASATSPGDSGSEGSNDSSAPSPTSSDSSHSCLLFPPSPMLRPRSTGPDAPTLGYFRLSPGFGQSPHS